ncbi:MAG: PTS mannose transporter subunit IIA, partial [Deltaproteobacteria bacterium]|nr:PTS mannose transporter subunit IIA [Deltaproteobacteria bacterium]
CAGGLAAGLAVQFGAQQPGAAGPWLAAGCVGLGVAGYWAVGRRLPHTVSLFLAACLAMAASAIL